MNNYVKYLEDNIRQRRNAFDHQRDIGDGYMLPEEVATLLIPGAQQLKQEIFIYEAALAIYRQWQKYNAHELHDRTASTSAEVLINDSTDEGQT